MRRELDKSFPEDERDRQLKIFNAQYDQSSRKLNALKSNSTTDSTFVETEITETIRRLSEINGFVSHFVDRLDQAAIDATEGEAIYSLWPPRFEDLLDQYLWPIYFVVFCAMLVVAIYSWRSGCRFIFL